MSDGGSFEPRATAGQVGLKQAARCEGCSVRRVRAMHLLLLAQRVARLLHERVPVLLARDSSKGQGVCVCAGGLLLLLVQQFIGSALEGTWRVFQHLTRDSGMRWQMHRGQNDGEQFAGKTDGRHLLRCTLRCQQPQSPGTAE